MKSLIIAVLSALLSGCHETAPIRSSSTAEQLDPVVPDLASQSQEKRNAAAKLLRRSYRPPAKTNWTALVASMTSGIAKSNLLELLRPFGATKDMGGGSGQGHFQDYRLDDAWILRCGFHNRSASRPDDALVRAELVERLRHVWVDAPKDFSGVWVTYFVNGNKAHEIEYKDGRYSGEFIAYHSDGPKAYVQHYNHHIAEGADTGYFRSGRTNYHGLYQANKQVGIWMWYNEDGSIQSTRDYSKP